MQSNPQRQEISNEYGTRSSLIWICGDITLGHSMAKFKERTTFTSHSSLDVVRLHFGLKGDYKFTYKQLHKTYDLLGGHHNMMYSSEFDMEVHNKTLEIETFGIQFPRSYFTQFTQDGNELLKRFSESVLLGKNVILTEQWGPIDPGIQLSIQQIVHNKYQCAYLQNFLLCKSWELLVLCAEACSTAAFRPEPFLKTKADKEKIIAVRDLILETAHCPPNFSEIAKTVGLNEYKLKKGFKETFNTTVFGYLTDQRLHIAYRLLRDTPKSAAEIAYELGYATPQHFNNAFKKKFGQTPSSVKK